MASQGKIVLPAVRSPTASSENVSSAEEGDGRSTHADSGANAGSSKKPVLLGDSGKPLRVFHGTPDEFVDYQPSETGEAGRGVYFTDDPHAASAYAEKKSQLALRWFESFGELENWTKAEYGIVLPWRRITERWSETTFDLPSGGELSITNVEGRYKVFFPFKDRGEAIRGAHVRPAFLRLTNPLDLRVVVTAEEAVAFAEGLAAEANKTLLSNVLDGIRYQGQQPRRFAFGEVREAIGAEELQRALERLGYDGTVIREAETNGLGGYNAYTVFSTDDVVPAFSPEGAALAS
jgi:hypothetical protein